MIDEEEKNKIAKLREKRDQLKEVVVHRREKDELEREIKELKEEKFRRGPLGKLTKIIKASAKAGKKFAEEVKKE